MTESNTSSPGPDVSTDNPDPVENNRESESESGADHDHTTASSDDATDTSAMARALKHELEQKGMTVEVEDDGETVTAEKLDQSYRIRPDGTVEGNGVLKDGIENIVADLDPGQDTEAENPERDVDPAPDSQDDSGESVSNTHESESDEKDDSSEGVTDENEVAASETDTPATSTETDSAAVGAEDATTTEQDEPAEPEREGKEEEVKEEEEEAESLPTGSICLFEASIEVGHLQEVIDAAHAIVDECRFHLDTDGVVIRAVDPANVAMVDEHVSVDAFEAYDTDCGEIGIDLDRLDEVVGIADNDDLIQFDLDPETRKLDVKANAVEYTLALIDPKSIRAEPDIPELDLPATISIDESEFKRAIRAADMVSDHISLQVDKHEKCFIANAEGDTDDVDLELSGDDLEDADWGGRCIRYSVWNIFETSESQFRRVLPFRCGLVKNSRLNFPSSWPTVRLTSSSCSHRVSKATEPNSHAEVLNLAMAQSEPDDDQCPLRVVKVVELDEIECAYELLEIVSDVSISVLCWSTEDV